MNESSIRDILIRADKNKHVIHEIKASGTSMMPLIPENSIIRVLCCNSEDISPGDVIVVYNRDKLVCHRCIKIKDHTIWERGDNCSLWIKLNFLTNEQLMGKVVEIVYPDGKCLPITRFKLYSKFCIVLGHLSNAIGVLLQKNPTNHIDKELSHDDRIGMLLKSMMTSIYTKEANR